MDFPAWCFLCVSVWSRLCSHTLEAEDVVGTSLCKTMMTDKALLLLTSREKCCMAATLTFSRQICVGAALLYSFIVGSSCSHTDLAEDVGDTLFAV